MAIRVPSNKTQLQELLDMAGFGSVWILNFNLIVKPLCDSLKGLDSDICTSPLNLYAWETGHGIRSLYANTWRILSTNCLLFKEIRSDHKRVASLTLCSISYLRRTTKSGKGNPGTACHCACIPSSLNFVQTKRQLLVNCWTVGQYQAILLDNLNVTATLNSVYLASCYSHRLWTRT